MANLANVVLPDRILTDFRDSDGFLTVLTSEYRTVLRGWTSQETAEQYAGGPQTEAIVRLYRRTDDQNWQAIAEFIGTERFDV